MNPQDAPLDPALFGPGPARDARFTVKDRYKEMFNVAEDHPEREVEFFHRQMHEELNSVENAAQNLADFPDADWNVRMWIARQAYDEARHVEMFRKIFESRGGTVGKYPVLCFQYRIISRIDTLIGRLAVQNRTFEAGGIDAVKVAVEEARAKGDFELAELYEMQGADEIGHVRFANEWIRQTIHRTPRSAMDMARALTAGSKAFEQVMGTEGTADVDYLADIEGRREAGFDESEVQKVYADTETRRDQNRALRSGATVTK
jgi:uncharacterized ferritin-like protein (DUF455 family)